MKVEGDSEDDYSWDSRPLQGPWRLRTIVDDSKWLATSFDSNQWQHVFREANFLAGAITSVGQNVENICIGIGCFLVRHAKRLYLIVWIPSVLKNSLYLKKVYYLAKNEKRKNFFYYQNVEKSTL